jgi:hypothetical protein
MAVGLPLKTTYANGDVYSASDVNDTNGTINITAAPFAAGKNKIINGDCNVNQRAFSSSTTSTSYIVDRFQFEYTGGTTTGSVQAFTAGTAPVTGYEAKQYVQLASTSQSAAGDYVLLKQKIESVRTFANQTATLSFWAKASSGTPKVGGYINQVFGSGGSAAVTTAGTLQTISTSWARYSITISVPSISGKTIGTSDYLEFGLMTSCGTTIAALGYPAVGIQNATIGLWGFQIENGSTATAFQTATGTFQNELAACQRYYWRVTAAEAYSTFTDGFGASATECYSTMRFPVIMRTTPAALEYSTIGISDWVTTVGATSLVYALTTTAGARLGALKSTGGLTAAKPYAIIANNSTSAYIGWSAEL